ncbi:UNVERIFIED_CONTAM: hypothetical protein Sangu_2797500 [Sesamum angustifolium]|uniref:Reverse transcriptase zinc-binding domain-containing protein n=1 Tax=Sesamum angustifolium TaxID=2727405 RepID=A0AAW2ISG6_9LAMI
MESEHYFLKHLDFRKERLPLRYLGLPLIASRLTMLDCQPLLQKIDARMRGWDGVGLSFAGRVQLIKSVLLAFEVYWAMAFLLPKGVIKEIVKRIRTFLWKGNSSSGYPKVAWESVCKPIEEGGQGIRDILALNRSLMSRHLWSVIKHEKESIWVEWIAYYRLRDASIWTVNAKRGAWSWRKMLELRGTLLPHIQLKIGTGESFSLWHDPWHNLGPLILRFPRGPQLTGTTPMATLSEVIEDNRWSWPLITDIAHLEIIQNLPSIHTGCNVITWDSNGGEFTNAAAYHLFRPPRPKVGWHSLFLSPFKIPRNSFILWLAILGRLSTMDKQWLQHLDGHCLLCTDGSLETHDHLFFACRFSRLCLGPSEHTSDSTGLMWIGNVASCGPRPDGEERNFRKFQHKTRAPSIIGSLVIEEVKRRILSASLHHSISTQGLYRLWQIPWPVEGNAS